ncbi:retrotransposon gag domain, Retroviral aspartyl protease [Artemisia annua]|uniref:Retrotransposon gag domain, Retroviral aspartyl protease n=1 Tax=Artemisia annua TaxID=35608 RepID=A0A2U1NNV3_ARTAN|nr:retrotransposon gag domain, Retroviral aspartyl protease [Artemisia annua]
MGGPTGSTNQQEKLKGQEQQLSFILGASLSLVPLSGNRNHGATRNNSEGSNQPPDPVAVQLAVIAKKLEVIDALQKDVATLKSESHNRSGNGSGSPGIIKGTLKVLEVEEGFEEQPTSEVEYMAGNTNDVAEISLHAIFGNTHPRTMKVQGMLHSTEVIILVDPGSTHNFISDALVKDLHLNTQVVARFSVQIGNGDFIRCGHICKNLPIQINELKIVQDFYPFSLGGADLVLGIQWFETLNTVQANWKEMFMIFNVDGKRYKWLLYHWFYCREIESMVQIRNNSEGSNQPPDPVAVQLAAIAKKLEAIDALRKDVATLKSQSHNRSDPRGWILKAEKYFRYYDILEEEKVDVASMHLEGDALDFYSWISTNQTIEYWEDLVRALQRNFGPTEFQNPNEHLCSVKQTGTVQEYRQEFAKRSSQVSNWPEHCLLGVFLNGLKEELKADGECYRCGEKYGPGHWCKTGTLKVLEVEEGSEEQPTSEVEYMAGNTNDVAEISLHAIFGNTHPRTMKVQGPTS